MVEASSARFRRFDPTELQVMLAAAARGCGANFRKSTAQQPGARTGSSGKNRIPHFRRGFVFDPELAKF
ncbi:hypothetical protein, partial [Methylocella tundrae]|uniref:hypothetical protein n=1 Tax=Methylocella tundrae TaxID=227605 RepID=UPI00157A527F